MKLASPTKRPSGPSTLRTSIVASGTVRKTNSETASRANPPRAASASPANARRDGGRPLTAGTATAVIVSASCDGRPIREDPHPVGPQRDVDLATLANPEIVQLVQRVGDHDRLTQRLAPQLGKAEGPEVIDTRNSTAQPVRKGGHVALDVPVLRTDVDAHVAAGGMPVCGQHQLGLADPIPSSAARNPLQ